MNKIQKEKLKKIVEDLINDKNFKAMKMKEIASILSIPKPERKVLEEILEELLMEGKIGKSSRGKYGRCDNYTFTGVYRANRRGFGFVTIENHDEDVFIPATETQNALDGDLVKIIITGRKNEGTSLKEEGKVVKIIEHGNSEIVGTYRKSKNFGFVIPDNNRITSDIYIPQGKALNAVDGHKVLVKITKFPKKPSESPEGCVIEILGHINEPGVDILSIVKAYGIPEHFSDELMKYAENISTEIDKKEYEKRVDNDYRDILTVTIDGEDAKDLDDAVSISYDSEREIYRLYVHIADVSNYVKEGSILDKEAFERSTSVYLLDRVIPMLPRVLSNNICSLNSGEDRLSLSCIMDIDKSGNIIDHKIAESIINVDKRMSYNGVHAVLNNLPLENGEDIESYMPYKKMIEDMYSLSKILREKRYERGGIDFDFPESHIELDEKGRVVNIRPEIRNESQKIIEDFMLAANETVAEDFFWREMPFLYRIHEKPEPERVKDLYLMLSGFGLFIKEKDGKLHPKEMQKLLSSIDEKPEAAVIKTMCLRTMQQAKYSSINSGHFGLAAKYYTHFTSPIRRYPDLIVHRIIKENLSGHFGEKRISHYKDILPKIAERTSKLERRADDAERDCERLKKCQYMKKHIGESFDGIISGVTKYGIYVQLENTVEGMVSLRMLSDYYVFDESTLSLKGEMSKNVFKIGDKLRVSVLNVHMQDKTIDFFIDDLEEK